MAPRHPQLLGRDPVQQAMTAALASADDGRAATVVVEGGAGSGKTSVLRWLTEQPAAEAFRPVLICPVEGEADLPLAVMTDVLRPLRTFVPGLAAEHRAVLEAAGGAGEAPADRLLLATATLALLAAAAEDRPLLLVVDDAQWVDAASGRALGFALRRLLADRVAAVVARRPSDDGRITGPWEPLRLEGLAEPHIAELLRAETGVTPTAPVVGRIREETLGNPLAVRHLARQLPAEALSGAAPLPVALPLREVADRSFGGLVRALPQRSRDAVTILAAAGSAAAQLAPQALRIRGLDTADVALAEEAGLVTGASGVLDFVHPLYRAAALEVAGPARVREAHAALAEAARDHDLQRHAWHRGLSVVGVDEGAAAVVERAAAAAERRVGAAATVGLRGLALALSPAGPVRDHRQLDSVRALVAAGHHGEARGHLQEVLSRDTAADVRAEAFHQLARLMLWDTPLDSQPVAEEIPADLPPRQLSATLAVAALRARNMGELARFGDLARASHAAVVEATAAPRDEAVLGADLAGTLALLPTLSLVAEADLVVGAHRSPVVGDVVDRVRRLLAAARGPEPRASAVKRGLVAMLDELAGSPAQTLSWTAALDLADELLALWLSAARARPASVAYLLMARTELAGWTADLRGGIGAADRAIEVSQEVGSHALTGWTHAFAARLSAAAADERACAAHRDAAIELGTRLSEPGPYIWSTHAYAQLLLGTGRYREAAEQLDPIAAFAASMGFAGVRAIPLQPDHVEALARSGRTADAAAALESWLDTMPADPDDWHRAVAARCRVLVHGERHVDELVTALRAGALALTPLEEARARLVAGQALHRRRRPAAAREMLEQAAAAFARIGAPGWRTAAEKELGGRGRARPDGDAPGALTLQEMRVAQEIAAGATNREAATRLFCSPKTVEYHLTRVYAKLGVRSRAALAGRIAAAAVDALEKVG
jgi:DNA-binding CsgD family transcriptional regulator